MKRFRKLLFWCHLAAGAAVALFVVIMAATGVLLTYQKQMTAWADRRAVNAGPPAAEAARLPTEELLRRAAASAGAEPTAITLRSRPDAPAEVSFGPDRRELVSVYTGAVLGSASTDMRAFFRTVTAWHRTMGATGEHRALGKKISGAANLAFLFLVVSGLYLWCPRNWSAGAIRNVLLFRRGLGGKARDFNWHHVIGFWSLIPLFVIVLSGAVISYRWAGNLVYRAVGEAPPPAATEGARGRRAEAPARFDGLGPLFTRAEAQAPGWTTITAQLPRGDARTMTFSLDRGMGGQPQLRSQLVLDRATGAPVKFEPFSSQSTGRRLRSILRFAHTGEVLGVPGQTLAGLVSLGALVLAWTGVALSLRRLRAWRARRRLARGGRGGPARPLNDEAAAA